MKIEVISMTDDLVEAYARSRPFMDKSTWTSDSLLEMNLSVSGFKKYVLYMETSILFRDMFMSFRDIVLWAKSNRSLKADHTNTVLAQDEVPIGDKYITGCQKHLDDMIEKVQSGEEVQDIAKRRLSQMTRCGWVVGISIRDIINIAFTFEKHCPYLGKIFLRELYRTGVLDREGYETKYNKVDLFYKVAMSKDDYLDKGYVKFGSQCAVHGETSSMILAQFIRMHSATVHTELWNKAEEDYNSLALETCADTYKFTAYMPIEQWHHQVSVRSCYFAQFDSNDKFSWAPLLAPTVEDMNSEEFIDLLPCKGCKEACKYYKSIESNAQRTESAQPCPLLCENPTIHAIRKDSYNSDSVVFDKWTKLIDEGYVRFNAENKLGNDYLEACTSNKSNTDIKSN